MDAVHRALIKLNPDWSAERFVPQVTPEAVDQLASSWADGRLDPFIKVRLLLACLLAAGKAGAAEKAEAARRAAAASPTPAAASLAGDVLGGGLMLHDALRKLSAAAAADDNEWVRVMGAAADGFTGRLDLEALLQESAEVHKTVADISETLAQHGHSDCLLPPLERKYLQRTPELAPPPHPPFSIRASPSIQPLSGTATITSRPASTDAAAATAAAAAAAAADEEGGLSAFGSPSRTGSMSLQARRGVLGTTGATDLFIPAHKQPLPVGRSGSLTETPHAAPTPGHAVASTPSAPHALASTPSVARPGGRSTLLLSDTEGKQVAQERTKTAASVLHKTTSGTAHPPNAARRSSDGTGTAGGTGANAAAAAAAPADSAGLPAAEGIPAVASPTHAGPKARRIAVRAPPSTAAQPSSGQGDADAAAGAQHVEGEEGEHGEFVTHEEGAVWRPKATGGMRLSVRLPGARPKQQQQQQQQQQQRQRQWAEEQDEDEQQNDVGAPPAGFGLKRQHRQPHSDDQIDDSDDDGPVVRVKRRRLVQRAVALGAADGDGDAPEGGDEELEDF